MRTWTGGDLEASQPNGAGLSRDRSGKGQLPGIAQRDGGDREESQRDLVPACGGKPTTDVERDFRIARLGGADRRLGYVRPPRDLPLGHAGRYSGSQELAAIALRELAPSVPSDDRRSGFQTQHVIDGALAALISGVAATYRRTRSMEADEALPAPSHRQQRLPGAQRSVPAPIDCYWRYPGSLATSRSWGTATRKSAAAR